MQWLSETTGSVVYLEIQENSYNKAKKKEFDSFIDELQEALIKSIAYDDRLISIKYIINGKEKSLYVFPHVLLSAFKIVEPFFNIDNMPDDKHFKPGQTLMRYGNGVCDYWNGDFNKYGEAIFVPYPEGKV